MAVMEVIGGTSAGNGRGLAGGVRTITPCGNRGLPAMLSLTLDLTYS